jgi:hypothetical protein
MTNKTLHIIAIYVLITLPGHLSSSRYSVGFVMLDIIFYVEFNRLLFVILYLRTIIQEKELKDSITL